MSIILPVTKKCIICGEESKHMKVGSSSSFGLSDLDLRPPGRHRYTMRCWVEECPFCGYVSADISELPEGIIENSDVEKVVYSMPYKVADGIYFESDYARMFYRHHMLCKELGDNEKAYHALLRAAWSCDDEVDLENAVLCRKKALEFLEKLLAENENNEKLVAQKADILRRSGLFDEVVKQFEGKKYSNEGLEKVIRFQVEKAKIKDDMCYTLYDVKNKN